MACGTGRLEAIAHLAWARPATSLSSAIGTAMDGLKPGFSAMGYGFWITTGTASGMDPQEAIASLIWGRRATSLLSAIGTAMARLKWGFSAVDYGVWTTTGTACGMELLAATASSQSVSPEMCR